MTKARSEGCFFSHTHDSPVLLLPSRSLDRIAVAVEEETETNTYLLSCHCQKNVLELKLPLPKKTPDHRMPLSGTADHKTPLTNNGVRESSHCLQRRIVWFLPRDTQSRWSGV